MKHLLIVDDEDSIRFGIKQFFAKLAYRVETASELEEAEALIAHTCYDVVILDHSLTVNGGAEGLELVRFIRMRCPKSCVIVLTANGSAATRREALRRGAHVFLEKPYPLPDLARVAQRLLEGEA